MVSTRRLQGKLIYSNQHDCFLNLPICWIRDLELFSSSLDVVAIKIKWSDKEAVVGWSAKCAGLELQNGQLAMDERFANVLDLREHELVSLEVVNHKIPRCTRIILVPTDPSSWPEITRNAEYLEEGLLQVIRIVGVGLRIPLWFPSSPAHPVLLEVKEIEPSGSYVVLSQETTVEISPCSSDPQKRPATLPVSGAVSSTSPFLSPVNPFPWSNFLWNAINRSTSQSDIAVKDASATEEAVPQTEVNSDSTEEIEASLRVQEIWDLQESKDEKYSAVAHSSAFSAELSGGVSGGDLSAKAFIRLMPVPETIIDRKLTPSFEIPLRLIGAKSKRLVAEGNIGMTTEAMLKLDLRRFSIVRVSITKESLTSAESTTLPLEICFADHPKFTKRKAVEVIFAETVSEIVQYTAAALSVTSFMKSAIHPLSSFSYNGFLVEGGLGTGKSSLIHCLVEELSKSPYFVHSDIIQCKYLRGRRPDSVRKLIEASLQEAIHKQPSVILFDDVDYLAPRVTNDNEAELDYALRIAHIFVELEDQIQRTRSRVYLIATTATRSAVQELLVYPTGSTFRNVTALHSIDLSKREKLLSFLISEEATEHVVLDTRAIALKTDGYVLRDICLLVRRADHHAVIRSDKFPAVGVTLNDLEAALIHSRQFSTENGMVSGDLLTSSGWDDVGGLGEVKEKLKDIFELPVKYPSLYSKCPIKMAKGVLLHGLPGTGKTFIAAVAAKEIGINFIHVRGPELLSKYIGASEAKVRSVFERAQAARPCLIFFDEFDAIAPRRGHDSTGVTDRVVNQLLSELDGVETVEGVYVLAATSRPELIDPAILRPGRIDKCIYCQLPNASERFEILSALSKRVPVAPDLDFRSLADSTEYFTGADLKAILTDAQLAAIEETMGEVTVNDSKEDDDVKISIHSLADDIPVHVEPSYKKSLIDEIKVLSRTPFDKRDDRKSGYHGPECVISNRHLLAAFHGKLPSVSESERARYEKMAKNLENNGVSGLLEEEPYSGSMKVTLA